ncbi:hypothetical protein Tsubulata_005811 [Turnera subulata]|uniref:protein-serine/threonine phosphatase n=1 Tax=Turnera subulata TaxID=218843 RepID=A0A9Q0GFW5_9ROSI|nr:hypothetical protein Tsubulata_005811 [Turnera subulata]
MYKPLKPEEMEICSHMSGHFKKPACFVSRGQKKAGSIKELAASTPEKPNREEMCEAEDNYLHDKGKGIMSAEEKTLVILPPLPEEEEEEDVGRGKSVLSYGVMSVLGRRRVMEDAVTVALGAVGDGDGYCGWERWRYDLFAVYDGHGGAAAWNSCGVRMADKWVAKEVEEIGWGEGLEYWREVMRKGFERMDEELWEMSGSDGGGEQLLVSPAAGKAGPSLPMAVVVLVGEEELVVANRGNSRALLCREGMAVPFSYEHKPYPAEEQERVEAAGGRIEKSNSTSGRRVLASARSMGSNEPRSMDTSRGDYFFNPYMTLEPEVTVYQRTDWDDFIVVASDGLWDVLSNEVVCEVVKRSFDFPMPMESSGESKTAQAAAMLVHLAMARGSKDNISVIVIDMKRSDTE